MKDKPADLVIASLRLEPCVEAERMLDVTEPFVGEAKEAAASVPADAVTTTDATALVNEAAIAETNETFARPVPPAVYTATILRRFASLSDVGHVTVIFGETNFAAPTSTASIPADADTLVRIVGSRIGTTMEKLTAAVAEETFTLMTRESRGREGLRSCEVSLRGNIETSASLAASEPVRPPAAVIAAAARDHIASAMRRLELFVVAETRETAAEPTPPVTMPLPEPSEEGPPSPRGGSDAYLIFSRPIVSSCGETPHCKMLTRVATDTEEVLASVSCGTGELVDASTAAPEEKHAGSGDDDAKDIDAPSFPGVKRRDSSTIADPQKGKVRALEATTALHGAAVSEPVRARAEMESTALASIAADIPLRGRARSRSDGAALDFALASSAALKAEPIPLRAVAVRPNPEAGLLTRRLTAKAIDAATEECDDVFRDVVRLTAAPNEPREPAATSRAEGTRLAILLASVLSKRSARATRVTSSSGEDEGGNSETTAPACEANSENDAGGDDMKEVARLTTSVSFAVEVRGGSTTTRSHASARARRESVAMAQMTSGDAELDALLAASVVASDGEYAWVVGESKAANSGFIIRPSRMVARSACVSGDASIVNAGRFTPESETVVGPILSGHDGHSLVALSSKMKKREDAGPTMGYGAPLYSTASAAAYAALDVEQSAAAGRSPASKAISPAAASWDVAISEQADVVCVAERRRLTEARALGSDCRTLASASWAPLRVSCTLSTSARAEDGNADSVRPVGGA
jgi:hypothetical protein